MATEELAIAKKVTNDEMLNLRRETTVKREIPASSYAPGMSNKLRQKMMKYKKQQ